MREILFRGKRMDNGGWVEGSFLRDGEAHRFAEREDLPFSDSYIVPKTEIDNVRTYLTQGILLNTVAYHVIPATVGQFTGLTDKKGKRIFEGDILKDDWGKIYKVIFTTTSCGFMVECTITPNEYEKGRYRLGEAWCKTIAVIGNIHDNSELLEVKND